MKKNSLLIILLLFLFTTANSQVIDEPYDFPIKPGMPEWAELTQSGRWKALQVPDDILKRLSTKALVETCLNYPLFSDFWLSNSNPKDGISEVMNSFNGFGELFLRQDAFTYLFAQYELRDPDWIYESWDAYLKFVYPEILLSQYEIIKGMSYEEKILLLKESYSQLEKNMTHNELFIYVIHELPVTLYLMVALLLAINEPDITAEINNSENITLLLNTMRIPNQTEVLINRIKELVNKAIQNGAININEQEDIPTYSLSQNYPNPFNPSTTILYSIPKDEFVKLTVYDITGKVVKELVNGYKSAGKYSVEFNASSYSSGTYYYKIEAGEYKNIQKMMLIK